jgi:hypothetical protein
MTYNWCYTWDHNIDKYDLCTFIDKNKVHKENYWCIYESKENLSDHTLPLRNEIEHYIGPVEYMGVWDYYDGFVDDLGPHKDRGDIENAVVFFCPRGELTVTLHDDETKEVLETVILNNTKGMSLYHTKFTHDVKGIGYLVVFGLSKEFDADSYFMK